MGQGQGGTTCDCVLRFGRVCGEGVPAVPSVLLVVRAVRVVLA